MSANVAVVEGVVAGKRAAVRRAGDLSYAIDIVSLSKRFKRATSAKRAGYTTIKSSLLRVLFRRASGAAPQFTHAVNDLTMRIPQGASMGIIGKNGSGKSTLLKLITGIYKPDTGSISVRGRVAALIELGAGFHPDFTGRENLFLGGVMHGLSREQIKERFDEIVDFAELRDVIDDPIRTYSSGMFMRLGFSLAIHTDPDVLLIDEVLAVGDAAFISKCKDKISRLRRDGKTLLLVTHDLEAVERWCDEVLWLHQGEVRDRGEPRRVIDHYRQFIEKGEELELLAAEGQEAAAAEPSSDGQAAGPQRWGSREIEITALRMRGADGSERLLFHPNDPVDIELDYACRENLPQVVFGIAIRRSDGLLVYGSNTEIERVSMPVLGDRGRVRCRVRRLGLLEGSYQLDVAVHAPDGYPYDYHLGGVTFAVRSPFNELGVSALEHEWCFEGR